MNNIISLDTFRKPLISFKGENKTYKKDKLNDTKINLNNIDTTGWVFSGGGAKGVFEAGVSCALVKAGMIPDVIIGTSVGSLNGAYLATGNVDGQANIWQNISKDKVYKTKIGEIFFKSLEQILNWIKIKNPIKLKSVLDNNPLRKLVDENIDPDIILDPKRKQHIELMMGVTGLNDG